MPELQAANHHPVLELPLEHRRGPARGYRDNRGNLHGLPDHVQGQTVAVQNFDLVPLALEKRPEERCEGLLFECAQRAQ